MSNKKKKFSTDDEIKLWRIVQFIKDVDYPLDANLDKVETIKVGTKAMVVEVDDYELYHPFTVEIFGRPNEAFVVGLAEVESVDMTDATTNVDHEQLLWVLYHAKNHPEMYKVDIDE